METYLFVYGTLRRGSDNKFARLLSERGQFLCEARVSGRLYDLGRYPGARRSDQPGESILGEVFQLDEPDDILAALDEYEGAEFERAMVSIPGMTDCWIYWFAGPAAGEIIASGDWFQR